MRAGISIWFTTLSPVTVTQVLSKNFLNESGTKTVVIILKPSSSFLLPCFKDVVTQNKWKARRVAGPTIRHPCHWDKVWWEGFIKEINDFRGKINIYLIRHTNILVPPKILFFNIKHQLKELKTML